MIRGVPYHPILCVAKWLNGESIAVGNDYGVGLRISSLGYIPTPEGLICIKRVRLIHFPQQITLSVNLVIKFS